MAAAHAVNHASMTPPSAETNPELWEYSVPVDAPYNYRRKPSVGTRERDYNDLHTQKTRRTETAGSRSRTGSTATSTKSHSRGPAGRNTDANDDVPANVRQNSDLSNRYQSNLYDGPESYNDENNPPSWADQADYDYESSRWIHRDKLAQIESEELRSAGIYVLPSERLEIDSGSLKRKRLSAGIYDNKDDQHQEESSDVQIFDLRTPEEIAADQMRLKNGSKIPLATTSPLPVPTEYVVRNTPLKRPQPSPESTPQTHTRKRSHSTGSNYLLDSSPIKSPVAVVAATPKSTVSTPASKKQTTPTPKGKQTPASLKKRTRSNPQLYGARPKTSSAAMPASPTHKEHFVPDGPPPWAVASYQPDPSLPPDQQIIPTVAKRLAQEKWEREGAFSDIYDRTLRPLRKLDIDNEGPKRRSQQSTKPAPEHLEPEPAPQPKRASYSTVPPPEPKPSPQMNGTPQTKPSEPIRVQDPESQEPEKKRGICCCIIM